MNINRQYDWKSHNNVMAHNTKDSRTNSLFTTHFLWIDSDFRWEDV